MPWRTSLIDLPTRQTPWARLPPGAAVHILSQTHNERQLLAPVLQARDFYRLANGLALARSLRMTGFQQFDGGIGH